MRAKIAVKLFQRRFLRTPHDVIFPKTVKHATCVIRRSNNLMLTFRKTVYS